MNHHYALGDSVRRTTVNPNPEFDESLGVEAGMIGTIEDIEHSNPPVIGVVFNGVFAWFSPDEVEPVTATKQVSMFGDEPRKHRYD